MGTLLMQSDASIGYELPLRMLVWDDRGETKVAYRLASELQTSYDLADRAAILKRMDELLRALAADGVASA